LKEKPLDGETGAFEAWYLGLDASIFPVIRRPLRREWAWILCP